MAMADAEPDISFSRSLPAIPWPIPGVVGNLHPDQSFLGKPIDPEIVARVRGSLAKYKGPKSLAEHQVIINAKAEQKQRAMRATTEEYSVWVEKVKSETVPSFKLPEDSRKGQPTNEQYIKKKVRKGLRDMRDKTVDYKAWIEDLRANQAFKMHEKLQEKFLADEAFNNAAVDRERNRIQRDAEIQEKVVQQSSKYWRWLHGMKKEVALRPNSAPPAKASGVESPASLSQKKRKESELALRKMTAEYSEWLKGVSQAKFELPYHPVVDREEYERRIVAKGKKIEEFNKKSAEYYDGVKKMEQKHHDRIMRRFREKVEADEQFNAQTANAAEMLQVKLEAERERQREIALKSRQEVREMKDRVKNRPLWIENAYTGK